MFFSRRNTNIPTVEPDGTDIDPGATLQTQAWPDPKRPPAAPSRCAKATQSSTVSRKRFAQAQACCEPAPDREIEAAAHVLAGVVSGLGQLVLKRLGTDLDQDVSVPIERLVPADLEPIFDEVLHIVAFGLGPTRP